MMKRSTNQNKLGMIDWMLSIDFDPVEISRVRRDITTVYAYMESKAIEPKE
jgi:hypothetical protein